MRRIKMSKKRLTRQTPKRKQHVRKKLRLKPGQVTAQGKLNDQLEKQLCTYLANQMTLEDACGLVGIRRETAWDWRKQGQDDPLGRYGKFEKAINAALLTAKAYLVHGLAVSKDIRGKMFLLKNRYPREFRDHVVQEITGSEGGPVAVNLNPFRVEFIVPAPIEGEFKIVDHSNEKRDAG